MPWNKQRAPPTQVVFKNAVLIIRKLIFWAHVLCLASETKKAGPAVPSGREQGSTETQKGLGERDILQWIHAECEEVMTTNVLRTGMVMKELHDDNDDDEDDYDYGQMLSVSIVRKHKK